MRDLRTISLVLFLFLAIPGWGETAGFEEVQEAVAVWHRVFGKLPALEQFIFEGRAPQGASVGALEAALEGVREAEASNPFVPLAGGALSVLAKRGGLRAAAAEASRLAGDRVAVRWLLHRAFRRLGAEDAASHELRRIRAIRDRLGLDRIAYLGWFLAHAAEARAARGDLQGAESALTLAEEFDPVLPEVSFARARIFLGRGSPRGLPPLIRGWWISMTSPLYGLSRWANVLASLLIAIPVCLLVVGLLFILRVTPLFEHDLLEWRRRRFSPLTTRILPIAIYLLPIVVGLGLLPTLLLSLLPLGIYLRGRERLLGTALVLSLLLLPGGYRLLATLITTIASPRYAAVLRMEEGDRGKNTEAALLRWAEEAPHDSLPRFYLGRVHRARGELKQGIAWYSQVQGEGAQTAAIWTNRGNLAFLSGDLARAQQAYEKAIALSPDLPYPHFNLSQLLTERLHFEQAQQEYARAMYEMPSLQDRMQRATADGRKQVLVDAPVPATQLWRQTLSFDSSSPEMAEILWGGRYFRVPLAGLPWVVGLYIVAFGGIFWLRKRRRFARACQECGKVFCPRCQRLLGEVRLCSRCAIIERARAGEVPPTIRSVPGEEGRREPRWIGLALKLVPGLEGLYRGRTLWGFLLLTATLFVVSPLLGVFLASGTYLPGPSLPYHGPVSILLLLCLYMLATLTYTGNHRRRPKERRWR
ncbi:MAG: tetratricopeptide repeat protein [Candidatus Methylomirabilales bacterium]